MRMSGDAMECLNDQKSEVLQVSDQFPVGLRVLIVDDDNTCLRVLEKMLRRCMYQVTSCSQAKVALNLLREKKGCFDLVLSDVHMPDMDGFKLLELVGLEMDLPVIMISADGRTDLVLRGIIHGACDYLIKPIRDEELKNIWQHVVRKRWVENKKHDPSSNVEDHERLKRTADDGVCDSSVSEGADEAHLSKKKKRNSKDGDDAELENDDPNSSKKPRVVWSVELHQQFVTAVHQLGIEKAVPKRILELMNVPGLTRENVASHLQKFRLYLKRVSGMSHQGVLPSFCAVEENLKTASLERLDIHALAASGQLPAQTLAALQTELMSRSSSNMMLLPNDPRTPPNASGICGSSCISADPNVAYGRPLIKCSSNISGQSCQPFLGTNTEFSDCAAKNLCDVASAANLVTANENNYALLGFMQEPQPNLKHCMMMEAAPHSVNVQPSCLVVPSLSSPYFQDGNGPDSLGQSCTSIDQSNGSIQLSKSPFVVPIGDAASSGFFTASPLNQLASLPWRIEDLKMLNMNCEFSSYNHEMNAVQGSSMNPLNPDKRSSLPSRFTMDDINQVNEITPYRVKQEPVADSTGNVRVGIPVRMKLPSNISMRILSD